MWVLRDDADRLVSCVLILSQHVLIVAEPVLRSDSNQCWTELKVYSRYYKSLGFLEIMSNADEIKYTIKSVRTLLGGTCFAIIIE